MKAIRPPLFLFAVLISLPCGVSFAAEKRPPNIIVILADDFGVGDIHAHYPGNKISRQVGSPPLAVVANVPVPEPATYLLFIMAMVGIHRIGGLLRQELVNV